MKTNLKTLRGFVAKFTNDRSGATALEYGIMVAVSAIAIATSAHALSNTQNEQFDCIATTVDTAQPGSC